MVVIKEGKAVSDPWVRVADDENLPANGPVLVSLSRWQSDRDALLSRKEPLGIVLSSEDHPSSIEDALKHIELVAIEFPIFRDGRGFSSARVLRDHYDFTGEIRAVGHILRDQLLFAHRSGFDAVEIPADEKKAEADWQKALSEISVYYQDMRDGRSTILRRRHGH